MSFGNQLTASQRDDFKSIGLSRAEYRVFLYLLEHNKQSIQEIVKGVSLPRSSIQVACESLIHKGVLKIIPLGKRRLMYIDDPRALEAVIRQEERQLESRRSALERIIPAALEKFARGNQSEALHVAEYSGEDGLIELFYKTLEMPRGSEILRFGIPTDLFTIALDKLGKYRKDRIKKGIRLRMILPLEESSESEANSARTKSRDVRFLPKSEYSPTTQVVLWQDYVSITVYDNGLHSILIKNRAYSEFMRQTFESLWSKAIEL
jgi:sugar-specific transcriptional regulator TrmB